MTFDKFLSICVCAYSCLTLLWPFGLWPARLLCPWDFPGKDTGVGCYFLFQVIFLTQRSNQFLLCLLHCRWILYPLSHGRSPFDKLQSYGRKWRTKELLDESKRGERKSWLKAQPSEKFMASGPIASWQIDGETVANFIFLGSKITADGDCSHEIKRRLLLGRKVMTNLDSILKSRDITLPTKVHLVKAMVFLIVMYGCESWSIKKAEHRRMDAFELWCWRRLLRVP